MLSSLAAPARQEGKNHLRLPRLREYVAGEVIGQLLEHRIQHRPRQRQTGRQASQRRTITRIRIQARVGTSSPPTRLSGSSSQLSLPSATAASQPHQRRLAPSAETGSPDRLNVTSSTAGRSSRRSTRRQRRKSGRPRSQSSKTAKPHSPSSRSKMTRTSSSSR